MATTTAFVNYVCEQLNSIGAIRFRKMFGEYMIYADDKPVVIVCDNIAYVKKLPCIEEMMGEAETGNPYKGAMEFFVLYIYNAVFFQNVVGKLLVVTPRTKKKRR